MGNLMFGYDVKDLHGGGGEWLTVQSFLELTGKLLKK
jgi:hypothetical protein